MKPRLSSAAGERGKTPSLQKAAKFSKPRQNFHNSPNSLEEEAELNLKKKLRSFPDITHALA